MARWLSPILSLFALTPFFLLSHAVPLNTTLSLVNQGRDVLPRAVPAAPHFVVYGNKWVSGQTGPPPASSLKGFNVYNIAFWLLQGPWDKAQEWVWLTAAERATIKSQYAAAGISLVVSVFGATDIPTTAGADPVATANKVAQFVKDYSLDGVDVDYEDFIAMDTGNGKAEAWLISFTRQLRVQLPQGQYILTHAPVAPWFSPGKYPGGAYLAIHNAVGNLIDWYNVQFYNQGISEYTTCDNLLTTSSSVWPQSAVFQIAASGVPLSKIVIGKPGGQGEANNGFMSTDTLATCLQTAKGKGWNGGAMAWQHPTAGAAWIQSVRSKAWPV